MGKKNKSKTNKAFKVAGAKSLKPKKKAKAVQGQLKRLAEMNRQRVGQVDKALSSLQNEVRQSKNKKAVEEKKSVNKVQKPNIAESAKRTMEELKQLKM